jgi:3-methyladenine DNA glycosylase AlkD
METNKMVEEIQQKIKSRSKKSNIDKAKRFFKEDIDTAGLPAPEVKKIAKGYIKKLKKENDINAVFNLAERLFISAKMEEVSLAMEILRHFHNRYTPQLFTLFNQWADYLTNWAHTDDFSTHHIAPLIKMDAKLIKHLTKWTKSTNRWRRRCSAVSLVPEARKGNCLPEVFTIASKLMKDTDVMVQKGVGWLLKEASRKHPKEVAEFLFKWKDKTTRLVLNYAGEKLPVKLKKKVLS